MKIYHVDVFSNRALTGNGLTVIYPAEEISTITLQEIAREFKQFETIFLWREREATFRARIFTVEEELDFAGHPILGAAATIHESFFEGEGKVTIAFELNQKKVEVTSEKTADGYLATMNQGKAQWISEVSPTWQERYAGELGLAKEQLSEQYPMEVVSTGLPYLLVPITGNIEKAKIQGTQFEEKLQENGAKFVYVFDVNTFEGRTWDNLGMVEDVATGSAAGPMGAYLYKHGCVPISKEIVIHQGRLLNRDSQIRVHMNEETEEVYVSGDVVILMQGELKDSL